MKIIERKVWAIIPAAGKGSRLQDTASAAYKNAVKQYLVLESKTILQRAIEPFIASALIEQIVVCLAHQDEHWQQVKSHLDDTKIIETQGGVTRAHSVLNGLYAIQSKANDTDWVVVHDAARALLTTQMLECFVHQLLDSPHGGIMAVPSVDTVKLSNQTSNRVDSTIPRETVWYAQTPQMFQYGQLRSALAEAIAQGLPITDESSAIELTGVSPAIIEGKKHNIKITEYADLALAEFYLKHNTSA